MMQRVKRWGRRGQSTLEYLLIAAAIIAAVVVAATTLIKPAVSGTMTSSKTAIDNAADQISKKLQ